MGPTKFPLQRRALLAGFPKAYTCTSNTFSGNWPSPSPVYITHPQAGGVTVHIIQTYVRLHMPEQFPDSTEWADGTIKTHRRDGFCMYGVFLRHTREIPSLSMWWQVDLYRSSTDNGHPGLGGMSSKTITIGLTTKMSRARSRHLNKFQWEIVVQSL
jgi:hypothetical protein